MTIPPGSVIAYRKDRLGARLIAIVSAMRIARHLDRPLVIAWPNVTDAGAPLNDPALFFAPDFIAAHVLRDADLAALAPPPENFHTLAPFQSSDVAAIMSRGKSIIVADCFDMTPFADEDPATVRAAAREIWSAFPFAPRLRDAADRIRQSIGPETTAYHLRRGDILNDPATYRSAWTDKFAPDDYYDRHIARSVASGIAPLIFSDNIPAEERLLAAWPTARSARDLIPPGDWSEGEADALALLALSSCRRVVATTGSAFSRLAGVLGDATLTDIVTDHPPVDRAAIAEALSGRLARATPVEIAASPGALAQSAPYLLSEARDAGALPQAVAILDRLIGDGLTMSFLYPLRAEAAVEAGLDPGISPDPAIRRPDLARLRAATALGLARAGQHESAARHAFTALAIGPRLVVVQSTLALLIAQGQLSDRHFLPMPPAMPQPDPNPMPPHLAIPWAALPGAPSSPAPLLVDWSPLFNNIAERDYTAAHVHLLMPRLPDTPAARAFALLLDPKSPVTALTDLARAAPDDAFVQHRLSRAAHRAEDHRLARAAAEAALALAPDQPARRAWRGLMALRDGGVASAHDDLAAAVAQGIAPPLVLLTLANLARRLARSASERAAIDLALALDPGNSQMLRLSADWHRRHNDDMAADRDIATLARVAPDHPALPTLRAARST